MMPQEGQGELWLGGCSVSTVQGAPIPGQAQLGEEAPE